MVNEATTAQSVVPDKLLTPHVKSLHVESASAFVHATHTTHAPTATVDSFSLLTLDIMDVHAPPAPGQCRWPHTYLMLLLLRTGTHASSRARPCTRADRRCEHHFLCLRGPSLGPLASCDHQHACRRETTLNVIPLVIVMAEFGSRWVGTPFYVKQRAFPRRRDPSSSCAAPCRPATTTCSRFARPCRLFLPPR